MADETRVAPRVDRDPRHRLDRRAASSPWPRDRCGGREGHARQPRAIRPGARPPARADPGLRRPEPEPTESESRDQPRDPAILAVVANDARMFVPPPLALWMGLYVSIDGGATWFNTFIPGFRTDTSTAGLESPLRGFASSTEAAVRFDAEGHLYVAGIAANFPGSRWTTEPGRQRRLRDTVRLHPGHSGRPQHATSAGTRRTSPTPSRRSSTKGPPASIPHRGHRIRRTSRFPSATSSTSPGSGWTHTRRARAAGRSTTPPRRRPASTTSRARPSSCSRVRPTEGGRSPSPTTCPRRATTASAGANIGTGPDGRVYVSWRSNLSPLGSEVRQIRVAGSNDCGRRFGKPVTAALFNRMRNGNETTGLVAQTPTLSWIAVDDGDADIVYVGYQGLAGPSDPQRPT